MSIRVHLAVSRHALWWAEHLEFHRLHREIRSMPGWLI